MALFTRHQRVQAQALRTLMYCNPFLPERVECEREALGAEFQDPGIAWNLLSDSSGPTPGRHNLAGLRRLAEALCAAARPRLVSGEPGSDCDLALYEDLAVYFLYYRSQETMNALIADALSPSPGTSAKVPPYADFALEAAHFLQIPGVTLPMSYDPAHLFALFFQVRRAFLHIYRCIVGRSLPAAQLRAAVWQSIFTHDIARYRRSLYQRMADLTTLITGPSGTGKELVARAIALSRYIPFDGRAMTFAEDFSAGFFALNVSALSPTLVESELFGHRRGAFTGADADRAGWLETCPRYGSVFLDEVGDVDPLIQGKLLRVLQSREFQRLGDTHPRRFHGKIIAATNRDLPAEMSAGRFRRDFYYRLCSDLIETPSLREQLEDRPGELYDLALFIASRIAGDEAESLAAEVVAAIAASPGPQHAWPGNFRELEQCVRSVLVRREFRPASVTPIVAPAGVTPLIATPPETDWLASISAGRLTADELLAGYCRRVYQQTGSYEQTSRRLNVDRRTVKNWLVTSEKP